MNDDQKAVIKAAFAPSSLLSLAQVICESRPKEGASLEYLGGRDWQVKSRRVVIAALVAVLCKWTKMAKVAKTDFFQNQRDVDSLNGLNILDELRDFSALYGSADWHRAVLDDRRWEYSGFKSDTLDKLSKLYDFDRGRADDGGVVDELEVLRESVADSWNVAEILAATNMIRVSVLLAAGLLNFSIPEHVIAKVCIDEAKGLTWAL